MPPALRPNALQFSESAAKTWFVLVEPGYSLDDVMQPEFYAHVSRKLSVHDKIDIVAADGAFDVTVRVLAVSQGRAVVRLSPWIVSEEQTDDERPPTGFRASWGGPSHKFRVVDTVTGAVVAHGFPTKEAAMEDIAARMSALEAA